MEPNQDNRDYATGTEAGWRLSEASQALDDGHIKFLAAIVQSSDEAIISTDFSGTIVSWNGGAQKLFGYSAGEAIGCPVSILFPEELVAEEVRILERIRTGHHIEHYETTRRCRDGRRVQVSLSVSPILDAGGRVIGASKIARDITTRKRTEKAQFALLDLTTRLFRATSVEDVYEASLDAITQSMGCNRTSILLFDDAGVMKFAAWRGLSDAYRQAVEGHSPWTPATRNAQPITIADIDEADLDPTLKATIKAERIAALAFIPLIAKGAVVGKFMTYYSAPHEFTNGELNIALAIARQLGFSLERAFAEQQRRQAEEAKELLLLESRHRIKNMLAIVQTLATQSLRKSDPDDLRAFQSRLRALGEAHELLAVESWQRAPLGDVVGRALRPFMLDETRRVRTEGPRMWVPASAAMNLTLCLHELATNAAKYGALSNEAGVVHVAWDVDRHDAGHVVRLTWREVGGPLVDPPTRQGFGSTLIQTTGEAGSRLDFDPDGLKCELRLSL